MPVPRSRRTSEPSPSAFNLSPKLLRRITLAITFLRTHPLHLLIAFILSWMFIDTDSYIWWYLRWSLADPAPADPMLTHNCPARNYSLPIVVVVPLIASQVSRLEWTVLRWVRADLPPCHYPISTGSRPELSIFFDRPFSDEKTAAASKAVRNLFNRHGISEVVSTCFQRVDITTANLTGDDNRNGGAFDVLRSLASSRGSNLQFERAFRVFGGGRYRHMWFMEPDTWPIRAGWLDAVIEESRWGDFWVRGTVMRYAPRFNIGWEPFRSRYLRHINGNAIYALDDPCFHRFRELVAAQFGYGAYDVARNLYLLGLKRVLTFQAVAHRFQVSRVVADLGVTQVHEEMLVKELPGTYLVHAKEVFKDIEMRRVS